MKTNRFPLIAALSLAVLASGAARAADASTAAGLALFDKQCAACHQPGGKGMAGLAPALAGAFTKSIGTPDGRRYVTLVLLNGLSGRIVSQGQTFMGAMPIQAALSDAELADLANYVARDLNGASTLPFTADAFAKERTVKTPHKDIRDLRERLAK